MCFMLLLLGSVFATPAVFAQAVDYSKIKVEQLSNDQILQMMTRAQSQGMSDADLYNSLQQQGMAPVEVDKLKVRVYKLKSKDIGDKNLTALVDPGEQGRNIGNNNELLDTPGTHVEDDGKPKIFGSSLFRNGNIKFEPNLNMATPANYSIGVGDQLLLDITGDNEVSYKLMVSPEGTIKVDYVGIIHVSGLSIEAAKSKLSNRLSSTYPALRNGGTSLDLTLGNIRSIKVTLTGFVSQPGTYTLPSVATVFNALYAAGGPSDQGSFRDIQVIRNNVIIGHIDTYDFLVNGIQTGNVRLEDQDVIHIPVYQTRVEFQGLVKRPGFFEVKQGEHFSDVLKYAGGFSPNAYSAKVKVFKVTRRDRQLRDIYADEFSSYIATNGDQYIVEEILDRYENRVQVDGAVFRSGFYELTPGMTVMQLLDKADGIKEDAFMTRAYINRLNPDNTQRLISFDLQKLLDGQIEDIVLRREDKVIVTSIFDLRDEININIDGEVRKPGKFQFADDMTLGNAIHMAGGLTDAANIERVEIARRIRKNTNERDSILSELLLVKFNSKEEALESDFILKPFDIVNIRTSTGYQFQKQVRIEGEVKFPGVYTLVTKDEKISDLIKRAGGFTEFAYLEGASLQRVATNSEIAVQTAKTNDGDSLTTNMEVESEEVRSSILNKVKDGRAETDLYFNNYIGIELERIVKKKDSKYNILLQEGDILTVPRQLQTVKVVGQVLSPISVVYVKGKSLKYYVNQAGGFTSKAHKSKTFIQYANGAVKGTQRGLGRIYPEVKPGSEIVVPEEKAKQRMSAQSIVGLSSSLISMIVIIVSLLK